MTSILSPNKSSPKQDKYSSKDGNYDDDNHDNKEKKKEKEREKEREREKEIEKKKQQHQNQNYLLRRPKAIVFSQNQELHVRTVQYMDRLYIIKSFFFFCWFF